MEQLSGELRSLLPLENDVFSGGLGLAAMGLGLGALRRCSSAATMLARRHLLMTLEVTSKDPSYPWVLNWLNAHGRSTQHLSVNTATQRSLDGTSRLAFELVPGPGRHLVWYDSRIFMVERVREHQTVAVSTGVPWEKVVLSSLGRDIGVFDALLNEARDMVATQEEGSTVVYTSWGTEWRPFGHPRRKRPLSSVVLDEGVMESILGDLTEWQDSAPWYHERGIPYRRGYLLHGPPGSGKTSFIVALAGDLDFGICILSLSDEGLTDDRLAQALSTVPQRCIVLLEDVDAAFSSRAAGDDPQRGRRSSLTFSGLLNSLDGVASSEDRVVFMTTNYIERLDPALMRPGRVDVVRYLGPATENQAERIFRGFFPCDRGQKYAIEFAEAVSRFKTQPSMAELQGHLVSFKHSASAAIENVSDLGRVTEERSHCQALQEAEASIRSGRQGDGGDTVSVGSRRISARDVDRIMFNPQPGWDKGVL